MMRLCGTSLLALGAWACSGCSGDSPDATSHEADLPLLVSAEWVAEQVGSDSSLILFDARSPEAYEQGHIPGAVSFHSELTWKSLPPESLMLDVSGMGSVLTERGVSSDVAILVYDAGLHLDAARLFWVLEAHGHTNAHVIEGGMQRWKMLGYPLETEPNMPREVDRFVPVLQSSRLSTTGEVFQAIGMPNVVIVDARPESHWKGETSITALHGHIPTALSEQWCGNIDLLTEVGNEEGVNAAVNWWPDSTWCVSPSLEEGQWAIVRDIAEFSAQVDAIGGPSARVIAYCNRGKQSAVTYLSMRAAGIDVSAYNGSWLEWCREGDLPVAMPEEQAPQEDL